MAHSPVSSCCAKEKSVQVRLTRSPGTRIRSGFAARAALRARLTADPNRLLALPYRLGVFLHSAWLLAAYTQLKNRFL